MIRKKLPPVYFFDGKAVVDSLALSQELDASHESIVAALNSHVSNLDAGFARRNFLMSPFILSNGTEVTIYRLTFEALKDLPPLKPGTKAKKKIEYLIECLDWADQIIHQVHLQLKT